MQSLNFVRGAVASVAFLAALSSVSAAPTRRQSATPGSACSQDGAVVCSGSSYQQCGGGLWTVVMPLAPGTDCSVWGKLLVNGAPSTTSTSSAATTSSAETTNAPVAAQAVAQPDTTVAPAQSPTASFYVSQAPAPAQPASTPATSSSQTASNGGDFSGSSGASTALAYQEYSGPASSFPAESSWLSFDKLWELNGPVCTKVNGAANGQLIHDDIQKAALEWAVDARVILAVILQESTCILGVVSTAAAATNSGLMQSHNGHGYDGSAASVWQMISDGVMGTWYLGSPLGGDGLMQLISQFGVYGGLRAYNSGSFGVNTDNLSVSSAGVASYVSDIANRLVGAKVAT